MDINIIFNKYKNYIVAFLAAVVMTVAIVKIAGSQNRYQQREKEKIETYKKMESVALDIQDKRSSLESIRSMFYKDSFSVISLVDKYARGAGLEVVSLNPLDSQLFEQSGGRVSSAVVSLKVQSKSINPLIAFFKSLEVEEDRIITVVEFIVTNLKAGNIEAQVRIAGGILEE
jgi:hypothetical protein